MKRILITLFLFCAIILTTAAVSADPEADPEFDGYIVRLDEGKHPLRSVPDGCEALGGGLYYAGTAQDAESLTAFGKVLYCEPNYILTVDDSYDGYVPSQWNLLSVGAASAWAHTDSEGRRDRLGEGVTVAVIDSGVMADHPDLKNADILDTVNLSTDEDGLDVYHGTFIAGILAAEVNNGIGTDGMTPAVTILPICITWNGGKSDVKTAVRGIMLAADMGADVINYSISGKDDSAALKEACEYAADRGVIMVTSAGNYKSGAAKSETNYVYPAAYDCVISVSACRQTADGVEFDADYSYFNDGVDVSAPGTDIVSLNLDGGTVTKKGTSFSAPVVTAMAVMARQADPNMDREGFLRLLEQSSVDLGAPGYDVYYGCGYVNVPAFLYALDASLSSVRSVEVGLSEPAAGAEPDYAPVLPAGAVYYSSAENDSAYSSNGVTWYDVTDGGMKPLVCGSDAFENGHAYKVVIDLTLDAGAGLFFSADCTARLNGKAVSETDILPGGQFRIVQSFSPLPVLRGDVDGDGRITPRDRLILTRWLAGWAEYDGIIDREAADVNEDGSVTAADRMILARYLAGYSSSLQRIPE